MKYQEWLEEWLENYIKPASKVRTYLRYREIAEKHLRTGLGDYEIEEITQPILQKYISGLSINGNLKNGKPLSSNSVSSIISVIQRSFKTAALLGYVPQNCAKMIVRPRKDEKEITCFTIAEQKKIEQRVMQTKKDKMFGVIICLYTGLRIGELLALTWEDIDLSRGIIMVTKSCHDGNDLNGTFCKVIEPPKTSSSKRIIPIPKQILPLLRNMKKNSKSSTVISNNGKAISVRSYQRSFELFLKRLEIPHKGFHALRHTFATRALECGMDVKTLSEILGHKSPVITLNRYAHSLLEHKREMMNKVGKLF